MEQHNTDILVIGAGLTGLTTAFRLTRGGKQVHILECSNRVGRANTYISVKTGRFLKADRIPE